ncbi:hypothetical protein [Mesorhizobium sp. B1-1-8]|uniref:hypothetical protein n=1 Tax=Mesorhizobium sp. B1-1-8 TaxID=2589976 RepID=UPI00112B8564|nr:hypothetical protein [Mesorhizobium sp. B1-1-8]UCI08342.1 hypothetical protein FJ974_04490 [Mesorhizobium sp. B1-1-8]
MAHVLETGKKETTPKELAEFVARSVDSAASDTHPFLHLVLRDVFPEDIYARMVEAMPVYEDYRPMHGRSKAYNAQGNSTRVKIDLFPEYIRHLPAGKREVWDVVGRALTSRTVQAAFVRRLAPDLEKRFGPAFARTGFFPIPILTRDIPGYRITPHTDTYSKGITVQLYLPRDASTSHIGTIFHERLADGSLPKTVRMQFLPNSGYAFSVSDYSWHSADEVGTEVTTRDSILLTYFVDQGPVAFVRNRVKRFGNFISNELRHR